MKRTSVMQRAARVLMGCALACCLAGCGSQAATTQATDEETAAAESVAAATPADGTYTIEAETDSSMFRSDSCTLTVKDGELRATLVLPGEGFSRLYFGTAAEAAEADDADIYDYTLNDEGKYSFDIPVSALDEELAVAAFGHRRDTWYDHTIIFHAPAADAVADAA